MKTLSIRLRLTLWYSVIVAVTFGVLGVGLFYKMREGVYSEIDQGLRTRLANLELFMQRTRPTQWSAELDEEFEEQSGSGAGSDLMQIRQNRGAWSYETPALRRLQNDVSLRKLTASVEVHGENYMALVAADTHQADAAISRFGWLLLWTIPVTLTLASIAGYWMSRRALSPVDAITNTARSIGAFNLSQRLENPGTGDELQRLTETLNGMIGRLDASFQKITQFTADASHELRTPITVIMAAAELSLRNRQDETEYRETLQQILEEAKQTTSLIEGLMILARSDSGTEALSIGPVDLSAVVAGVVKQGRTLAEARRIRMLDEIPKYAVELAGDADKLSRLLLILVDNAIKYTAPGGTVSVRMSLHENSVRVAVQDSGIGISAADLPNIFERFYRADKARSRESGGFGLGLSIAKWIADAHKAVIDVESAPDRGSTFTITFPMSLA